MTDVILIDTEDGIKRVMNNEKLYVKLLVKFKEGATFDEFNEYAAAGDMEKAKISIHTLKGLAANLSLMELNRQCQEIEALIKAGSSNIDQLTAFKDIYHKTLLEIDKVVESYDG